MKQKNQHSVPFKLPEKSIRNDFSVPDGYFDNLPTIIQAKAIKSTKKRITFSNVGILRLAIPALLLLIIAGYWGYKHQNNPKLDARIELILADISTEEMVDFLDQTDLSSDDLLEMVSFEGEKIDDFSYELENITDEELELLINDFGIERINDI